MTNTLYAILTDFNARSVTEVETNISQEFTAGAPWW